MKPIICLIVLYIAEFVVSPKKNERYRNVDLILTTLILCITETVADILLSVFTQNTLDIELLFYVVIAVQAVVIIGVKLYTKKKDSFVTYGLPKKYTSGRRFEFIGHFYDFDNKSPVMYIKSTTTYIGIIIYCCVFILIGAFVVQSYLFDTTGNMLMLPYSAGGLVSLLIEFGLFCNGESLLNKLISQYNIRKGCLNRRDLAKARYSSDDDFNYAFMKNHVCEPGNVIRSTKLKWKRNDVKNPVAYYNFSDHSTSVYETKEHNEELEAFIEQNNLEVNDLYITAYNLIDRNQNVLIKTPSYVDFEPYLTALIKMKVAKTQKVVLVVSNEEKKNTTIKKIKEAFKEYFGFESIPVISTIDECVLLDQAKKDDDLQQLSESKKNLSSFYKLASYGKNQTDESKKAPVKDSDIIIASPEDICDTNYVETIRATIKQLGLIVYYDFSDCAQEEALFSKIVHSVLDYKDEVSTLYMSDGFFDLEQVLDNFFSKRNLYKIVVPRKPSETSYVMAWKAEKISEIQARTMPDASRNIGNHIPILYDSYFLENDFMVVEDEYDTYSENYSNLTQNEFISHLDCHVGWSDVLGGKNVFCTVSDTYNNVAHAYLAMRGIGSKSEYINVISRPYLLRNYLMYHLRYFSTYPDALSSYSPGMIKTSRAIAYEAVVKAFIAGCTVEQLHKYIEDALVSADNTPESMLSVLAETAYGEPVENIEITKDIYERYFIDQKTYHKIIEKSGFIEKVEFVNNNKVFKRNKRNYNCLIPQQKIVLNGIKYTVQSINGNRVELTDSNLREPIFVERTVRTCKATVNKCETYGNQLHQKSDGCISFRCMDCDVDLVTHGNIVFKDNYHPFRDDCRYEYHEVIDKPHKKYKGVNIFSIKITNPLIASENRAKLSFLLASILKEMMPTFFPRHSDRIIICCNDWVVDPFISKENINNKHIVTQLDIDDPEIINDNQICLYILEDSALETGLVNVFWQDEEVRYMLKILEDYLYYQEMIRNAERYEMFNKKDIENLHCLRKILLNVINETTEYASFFFYLNSIRRSRNKFNELDLNRNFNMTCDFCGKSISSNNGQPVSYHFYSYSGMVSCLDCYKDAVCAEKYETKDIALFRDEINDWFLKKYDETITNPFYNYLEDAEVLADISGYQNRYIVTDDADIEGVEGVSCKNQDKRITISVFLNAEGIPISFWDEVYDKEHIPEEDQIRASYKVFDEDYSFILIRDGLPKKTYKGVLCHEMVHQWQFTYLDCHKMQSNAPGGNLDEFGKTVNLKNFRIEGQAEWERIRYLKKIRNYKGARKAVANLNNRMDAYGYGYRWMRKMMIVGNDDKSIQAYRTLGFILKRNYYQLTKNSFALMRLYFEETPKSDENQEL